jgi:hypothetical protein
MGEGDTITGTKRGWRRLVPFWKRKGSNSEEERLLDDEPTNQKEGFGDKSIPFWGGFCLLLNNTTGPAMVGLPVLYQQAGYITPTLCMVAVMAIASFSCTMLCKAMALVPGNDRFQQRVELSTVAKIYFNRWGYYFTMLLLVISLQATNISSIIISAQTMDFALVAMFKYTCGWEFYPDFRFFHVTTKGDDISPFGDVIIFSLGFLIVLLLTIPMGYFNLDDNIYIQVGACMCMIVIVLGVWMADFVVTGLEFSRVAAWGPNQSQVLGTIIFNYAYVVSIPSWVNEKREDVSINKSVWYSSGVGTFIFVILGIFGGWAFDFPNNNDILDVINTKSRGEVLKVIAEVSVYVFPIVVLLSSIPVYSIIIRYNLIESGLCGKHWANVWAVLFPWAVSVPFYTGSGLSNIIGWVGLFVNGVINFIIPLILYIFAIRQSKRGPQAAGSGSLQIQEEGEEEEEEAGTQEESLPTISPAGGIVFFEEREISKGKESTGELLMDAALQFDADPFDLELDLEEYQPMGPFHVLPEKIQRLVNPMWLAATFVVLISAGIVATIGLDLYGLITGNGDVP